MTATREITNEEVLDAYERHMRTAQFSQVTIIDRLEFLRRLAAFLPGTLLTAEPIDLERFQQSYSHLSWATVDIYTRHVLALYRWLTDSDRLAVNPTRRLVRVKRRKGVPHPIDEADLRKLLTCATGGLRITYALAAFAGLRRGEICRLRVEDLRLDADQPHAYILGKGDHERIVPLLPPIVAELRATELPRRGPIVLNALGRPYTNPDQLSMRSTRFMKELGIDATLHACRHYFATEVVKLTKDILLVRDLLGHSSVATTQIYMASTIDGTQDRLTSMSGSAAAMLSGRRAAPPRPGEPPTLALLVE